MDEVFLVELNRFCCSIARGNVGKDLDWSLMLIADPGVLDKCALVDTAKDKRHWIWNGHSLLFYTKDSYLDIREDRFSEYLSKCSHSSLALECHMSLLDYCHIVLIKTCHVIDLTFDIHFTDGNGQFAHDDIMDFCEYYKYRWSKTTHPRTLNINIDSRQLAHYAIMDVCEELEYKWSESTHPRTLNINITGYDCEEEEEREEFLGQVNHFCCSLVKVVVQCQDEYKFVLSAVAGILDKHALVGLVKNVLMCQWKWDEVGHKTVLTVTNSSKYPAYLDDISLDDELFEGITFPQQTLDCEQDQSGLVSLCPPSSVHPSHPSQSLLSPPLPPAQPSSLSYTQTTEASQTDGCQDHPNSATSNDQQHNLSSDLPNPYSMHSVVHNCGHSTEQEPEVRKDEAVARQSKGKDTRGKIPQKSSSVPHVDLPPNKRTRQMPPTDQL